jgi:hypothetical protein
MSKIGELIKKTQGILGVMHLDNALSSIIWMKVAPTFQ